MGRKFNEEKFYKLAGWLFVVEAIIATILLGLGLQLGWQVCEEFCIELLMIAGCASIASSLCFVWAETCRIDKKLNELDKELEELDKELKEVTEWQEKQ